MKKVVYLKINKKEILKEEKWGKMVYKERDGVCVVVLLGRGR